MQKLKYTLAIGSVIALAVVMYAASVLFQDHTPAIAMQPTAHAQARQINTALIPPTPAEVQSVATPTAVPTAVQASQTPFFAHYYLWWDAKHWQAKLGDAYTAEQSSLALPAQLADDGCSATSAYANNQLIDIPDAALGMYSQDDPATFDRHIHDAADAGISGFVVSWAGNGQPDQTADATPFSRRLDVLVQRVAQYNASHPAKFSLMLGYEGLNNARKPRSTEWVKNDLAFFASHYMTNSVFHIAAYDDKAIVMVLDSRKFSLAEIATITSVFDPNQRKEVYLIGDEHGVKEWNRGVADYFDGDGWYWSDENPYTNPNAFATVAKLADLIHGQKKLWFAPLNGGYNKSSFGIGGDCIPRNNGETIERVYQGNRASAPDGWMYISWNEFYENTYLEPSLRYGRFYLDAVKKIISAK